MGLDSIRDQEVIAKILAGDVDSFAILVRQYHVAIRSYCFHMLRDHSLAEDAAQDIFRKAYSNLSGFRAEASFKSWLYRIATNQCRDLLRSARRKPTESWDELVEIHGDRIGSLLTSTDDPPSRVEDVEIVSKILEQMPEDYREIILLKELDGLSYQEIAQTLECSLDAVKGRLKRARALLDEKLRHFYTNSSVTNLKRQI